MSYVLQRLGLRFSRGWAVAVLLIAAAVGSAFWIGPLRPPPAALELVALDRDGRFVDALALSPAGDAPDEDLRYALLLGVRNVGPRAARPATLSLTVPAGWELTDRQHQPLPFEHDPGVPLSRYTFRLPFGPIEPGALPALLPGIDTLWLAPRLDRIVCRIRPDGVPDFVPAPLPPAELMAAPVLYYSFGGRALDARHTGTLSLRVDPAALRRPPPERLPAFPSILREPEAPRPATGALVQVGERVANCGDSDRPVELHSVVWQTASGGRMIVVYHAGAPRKQLFDLDGDGVVETEMWDPDADGRFEGLRPARFPIPEFLLPRPGAMRGVASFDTTATDSVWRALLADTAAGPFRFTRIDSLRRVADSVRAAAAAAAAAAARRATELPPGVLGVPVPTPPPVRDTAADPAGAIRAPGVSSREWPECCQRGDPEARTRGKG